MDALGVYVYDVLFAYGFGILFFRGCTTAGMYECGMSVWRVLGRERGEVCTILGNR